jgi:hypothetical protein
VVLVPTRSHKPGHAGATQSPASNSMSSKTKFAIGTELQAKRLDTLEGQVMSGCSYHPAHIQTWNPRSRVAT